MKGEVLSFRKVIQPNEEGTLKERVKANGTVREVSLRFYPGQEKNLKVNPFVLHKNNRHEDMFTFVAGTDGYLSGDDDFFTYPVTLDVEYDDEIAVYFHNVGVYPYSLVCDIQVVFYEQEVVVNG